MKLIIVCRIDKREKNETRGRKTSVRGFEMTASLRAYSLREKWTKADGKKQTWK